MTFMQKQVPAGNWQILYDHCRMVKGQ